MDLEMSLEAFEQKKQGIIAALAKKLGVLPSEIQLSAARTKPTAEMVQESQDGDKDVDPDSIVQDIMNESDDDEKKEEVGTRPDPGAGEDAAQSGMKPTADPTGVKSSVAGSAPTNQPTHYPTTNRPTQSPVMPSVHLDIVVTQTFKSTDNSANLELDKADSALQTSMESMAANHPLIDGLKETLEEPVTSRHLTIDTVEVPVGVTPKLGNPPLPKPKYFERDSENTHAKDNKEENDNTEDEKDQDEDEQNAKDQTEEKEKDLSGETKHPCDDGSHSCDKDRGVCIKTGAEAYTCGCSNGFECIQGCPGSPKAHTPR